MNILSKLKQFIHEQVAVVLIKNFEIKMRMARQPISTLGGSVVIPFSAFSGDMKTTGKFDIVVKQMKLKLPEFESVCINGNWYIPAGPEWSIRLEDEFNEKKEETE